MKKLMFFSFTCLLLCNCQRTHYYCVCYQPYYEKDYDIHYFANKEKLTADCNTHKVNANKQCGLGQ